MCPFFKIVDVDIQLSSFSDSEGSHSNCNMEIRMALLRYHVGLIPATVIDEAPGSVTAMLIITSCTLERLYTVSHPRCVQLDTR